MLLTFWSRRTYFFHLLAKTILKIDPSIKISGLVLDLDSFKFLSKQTDVDYEYLYNYKEKCKNLKKIELNSSKLEYFEDEYGPFGLWPYIYVDRFISFYNPMTSFSHDELKKIIYCGANFIEKMLIDNQPDVILQLPVDSHVLRMLSQFSIKLNINVLQITPTRINKQFSFINNDGEFFNKATLRYEGYLQNGRRSPKYKQATDFVNLAKKGINQHLDNIEDWLKSDLSLPRKIKKLSLRIMHHSYHSIIGNRRNDYYFRGFSSFKIFRLYVKYRINNALVKNSRIYSKVDLVEEFCFYPLHFEPEGTMSILGYEYMNQGSLIEKISRSLPINQLLYVKDHPAMFRNDIGNPVRGSVRTLDFYKQLKKLPNVKIINPAYPSSKLIKNSNLVFTISGTAGFEGLIYGKPVIVFGHPFYSYTDLCINYSMKDDLHKTIKNALTNFKMDHDGLIQFIASIFEESFECNVWRILQVLRKTMPITQSELAKLEEYKEFQIIAENLLQEISNLNV